MAQLGKWREHESKGKSLELTKEGTKKRTSYKVWEITERYLEAKGERRKSIECNFKDKNENLVLQKRS